MHDDLKRQGAFSWSELLSRDLTGSVRFYRDLLGWDIVKKTMDGEPYYIVRVNGEDIASMMKMPVAVPSGVPTYWGTYITVFDVDAIANAVVPLGQRWSCHRRTSRESADSARSRIPTEASSPSSRTRRSRREALIPRCTCTDPSHGPVFRAELRTPQSPF